MLLRCDAFSDQPRGPSTNACPSYLCVCARLCVFVCLSLVITLKTSRHWFKKGPSGSLWPHPDMSSVGGKDMIGGWQWTSCSSHDACQTKCEDAIDKTCYNYILFGGKPWTWTYKRVAVWELVALVVQGHAYLLVHVKESNSQLGEKRLNKGQQLFLPDSVVVSYCMTVYRNGHCYVNVTH